MPDTDNNRQVMDSAGETKKKVEEQARAYTDEARARASEMGGKLTGTAAGYAAEAQSKAAGYGTKMQEQADRARGQVADGMESAAGAVRERSESVPGVGKAGSIAAEGMQSAAGYIRGHRSRNMFSGMTRLVRKHSKLTAIGVVIAVMLLMRLKK